MRRFSHQDPVTNNAYLFNKTEFLEYETYFSLLIAIPSQSPLNAPLPDTVVLNDLKCYSSNENVWLVPNFSLMKDNPKDYTVPCSVELFLSKEQNSNYLLNKIQWYHPINDAISIVKESTIIVATDGSSKIDASVFSWIISTTMNDWIISNTGICAREDNYLYKSEITAILSLIFYFWNIFKYVTTIILQSTTAHADSNSF